MKLPTILLASVFSTLFIAVSSAVVVADILSPATRSSNIVTPSKRAPSVCPPGSARGVAETTQEKYDKLVYYYTYAYAAYSDKCITPNINIRDDRGNVVQMQTSVKGNRVIRGFEDKPTDTQIFVAVDAPKKEIIVAFRGSYNDTHNLNVPKDVRVHRGFLEVYKTISNELAIFLRDELSRNPGFSIVTTGHSLGGALASLSGVIFHTLMKVPVKIYTYGQPRTGNAAYVRWIESTVLTTNIYRSVNRNDPVPHLPLQLSGYAHHGVEYWTCADETKPAGTYECHLPEQKECSRDIKYIVPKAGYRPHRDYFAIAADQEFCTRYRV